MPPLYAQASTFAGPVDNLAIFLLVLCSAVATGICVLIGFLAIKYHHSHDVDRTAPPTHSLVLEVTWTGASLVIAIGIFFAGAWIYVQEARAPEGALQIYIVGKQWMWKAYYPDGQQEINGLHVPVGRPVKLIMTSQDVIHSFYVPAFRVKCDLLPGSIYSSMWFQATEPGTFHLFCAEYCGTKHSEMVGLVQALDESRFEEWLSGRGGNVPLAQAGAKLYQKLGCVACHSANNAGTQRGPKLEGLFGHPVKLNNGQVIVADENYIRESIQKPTAKIVDGYQPIMPTYEGQVSTEELNELLAYVKSLAEAK